MTRTIEDLRETFERMSAFPPENHDRGAEVRRRIRRGARQRMTLRAGACLTALAVAGVAVPQLYGDRSEPLPAAGESGSLPATYKGMPRIAFRGYTVTGKYMRVEFTPTGRDTTIIVQCRHGFAASISDETTGGASKCWPHKERIGGRLEQRFGSESDAGPQAGQLKPGKRVVINVAVYTPSPELDEAMLRQEGALDRYLATHPPGSSPWMVAVYSGRCKEDRQRLQLCP